MPSEISTLSPAPPRLGRIGRLLLTVLATTLIAVVVPAGAAQAHPFGPPQTVTVDGADDTVRVRWRVGGTDDLTLLGVSLGVLDRDRVMLDGAVFYEDGDAGALAAAPAFRAYLLDHIAVSSAGQPCTGDVTALDALATTGVDLAYRCPGGVDGLATAAVSVTTLTDLHPAYRTLATGPAGQRAVYDAEQPTHDWSFDGTPAGDGDRPAAAEDLGTSAALQLGAVLGVLLLAVLAGLVWFRRRGRRA